MLVIIRKKILIIQNRNQVIAQCAYGTYLKRSPDSYLYSTAITEIPKWHIAAINTDITQLFKDSIT